jgi:hypothetical protein
VPGESLPGLHEPPPDASVASFGEELERLGATPPDTVFEEFEELARVEEELFGHLLPEKERLLGTFLGDPESSLKKLVDALKRYHDLVVLPHWPRIREHVEADTLRRGQALAIGGVEALLSGLHPKVDYAEGVLTLEKDYEAVVNTGEGA